MVLVSVDDLEKFEPRLLLAKKNRSIVEYYFTLTPILPQYLLKRYEIDGGITYLDSDTFLFSSPEPVFEEIGDASVAIVNHRFPMSLKYLEIHGKFNVGWLTFNNSDSGRKCLEWYAEKCLEWCYDRVESNRFADQKYLEYFKDVVEDVHIIENIGCNLAPWNIGNHVIKAASSNILVDGQKLILFHFEKLKMIVDGKYDTGFSDYKTKLNNDIKQGIYIPYIKLLVESKKRAEAEIGPIKMNFLRNRDNRNQTVFNKCKGPFKKIKLHYLRWKYNSVVLL
jgi:hypothetical protein